MTFRYVLCTSVVVFNELHFSSGGFAFLPFLWLVNVMWFFKEAFLKPAYTEQPQIKSCEYVKEYMSRVTRFHKTLCFTTLLRVIFFLTTLPTTC